MRYNNHVSLATYILKHLSSRSSNKTVEDGNKRMNLLTILNSLIKYLLMINN